MPPGSEMQSTIRSHIWHMFVVLQVRGLERVWLDCISFGVLGCDMIIIVHQCSVVVKWRSTLVSGESQDLIDSYRNLPSWVRMPHVHKSCKLMMV